MDSVAAFESVRDIPYRIALSSRAEDNSCSGKSDKLFGLLTKGGYKVRYRVCEFLWSSMGLPKEVEREPHDNLCTHTYLEIRVNGKWRVLDATWDEGLSSVLHVNHWDGRSDTEIAVKPIKVFAPKKSLSVITEYGTKREVEADLRKNRKFYRAFNGWAERARNSFQSEVSSLSPL